MLFNSIEGLAQVRTAVTPVPTGSSAISSSPAFAEILLRKTELDADIESFLTEYTEDYPKVKETRYQAASLQKDMNRLLALKPAEASKLTLALGKLIVRKCELETDLWGLLSLYKDGHPDVKRAKRKLEIYEQAIKQILS
jgi:hypothetical protein